MNILLTGASKGIGYVLCRKFIYDGGHNIIAISRTAEAFDKQLVSFDNSNTLSFSYLNLDLTKTNFKKSVLPLIVEKLKNIDIIINNAGLLINKPFEELTDNDFDDMFDINVKSVFRLIRDLIPIINKGAHIVNISSIGGLQGSTKFPGLSLYSASKGAIAVLTECLAEELKDKNISANALALGAVQTHMLNKAFPNYKAPLSAKEMANFIFDFALNGQKYFNGKILPVSLSTP
ncbi:MAG: SDR family oxidoreductase [Bacteroidetes bacterium]|nr:SDR family oxidoreductase [Bacteroidota bacterium]MBL6943747.1 SDR family oxidoreductase [Bacteroidales bacterium]